MKNITLGPESSLWGCMDCGQLSVWHPGNSGLAQPQACCRCDSTNVVLAELCDDDDPQRQVSRQKN